jgi:7-carboxy-7-deazaguanine synthase
LLARQLDVTWSVSPKLSLSGESWAAAIRPTVLNSYQELSGSFLSLKFVVEIEEDIAEAEKAVLQYRQAGVLPAALYVMPVGGSAETYAANRTAVGAWALKRGWSFSPRLHVDLFGNRYGT